MPAGSSGEKTEKATPKRREDARKKGQVLKSTEVNTAVTMAAMFGALALFGAGVVRGILELLTYYLSTQLDSELTGLTIPALINDAIGRMFGAMWPLLLVAVLAGVAVNLLQVGFFASGELLRPKFSRISPAKGLKRIFSLRSIVEMLKAVLKISIVTYVVYSEYMDRFGAFPHMMAYDVATSTQAIFDMCLSVAFKAAAALAAIGVADYLYQWYDYEKNLRMTKQEVKDEYKMVEGDPQIKGKIKRRQREMAALRMMQAVPEADVVVTNPTHYAVALKYDDKASPAPVVIAKGKDLLAGRIKERAREAKVEIVENKPVAQALYLTVEVGRQIPEELYQAVAEILAYVYNLRKQGGAVPFA
ncbi:MAG: flagellar biosynthesis protein FlhB [Oscillospiraceae bacterium]|nr:flagellar biosynthesis protein FlhB [Oscillospiraceae bacterium]